MPAGRRPSAALLRRRARAATLRLLGVAATRLPVPTRPERLGRAFAAGAAAEAERALQVHGDPARAARIVERMHERGLASGRADTVLLKARRRLAEAGAPPPAPADTGAASVADRLRGVDRAQLPAAAAQIFAEGRAGRRGVMAYLLGADEWELAGTFLDRLPAGEMPLQLAVSAVKRARRAGHLSATVALAERVLAVDPGRALVRELAELSRDELRVLAEGLPEEPPRPTPYQPGERRVLALLQQSLPIKSGGYATRSHGILRGLADRGWEVRAATRYGFPYDMWPPGDDRTVPAQDEVDGLVYQRLLDGDRRSYPKAPLTDYVEAYAQRVVQVATEHRARLLHASSFHLNGLAAAVAARRLGIPSVYEMRGLDDLMQVSRDPHYADSERYRFLVEVERQSCLRADRVLVITEALRAEMIRRGVPTEKISVLPNGVDTARFQPRERDVALARELGVEGRTVIGYVGGLVPYEGLELLLQAAARLRTTRDDFAVLVVGDGYHEKAVHDEAERLRLGRLVTFTGRVPHSEVGRYLSLVDVAPFPRLPLPVCELISPIKPFESMAMGKAVVVSDVAALTEIVQHGETGLTFHKGDAEQLASALERLVGDPPLRARLGANAQRWVRAERDWSSIVARAEEVYTELLEAPTPHSSVAG